MYISYAADTHSQNLISCNVFNDLVQEKTFHAVEFPVRGIKKVFQWSVVSTSDVQVRGAQFVFRRQREHAVMVPSASTGKDVGKTNSVVVTCP